MNLTLVRHGHAHRSLDDALPDDARVLSKKGREAVRATGRTLLNEGISPTVVWSSPLLRALQTAELLASELSCLAPVEVLGCLEPGGDLGALLARIAELPDDVDLLLTSHEPTCSRLVSILTGTPAPRVHTAEAFRMKLDAAEPGGATLSWHRRGAALP